MANPERKNIIREIGGILFKTAVVVGIIGILSRYIGKERFVKIGEIFSRKKEDKLG